MPNSIDDLENNLDKRIEQRLNSRNRSFFYLTGSAPDRSGKMRGFLLGPYPDFETASKIAERKHLTSWEAFESPSSDLGRTGQILRARKLHGNSSFADIFQKNKHKNVGQEDTI
jgi:hypothetical protein